MSDAPLRVERTTAHDVTTWRVSGQLDRHTVPLAHARISADLRGRRDDEALRLDFSEVERMDTAGAALVRTLLTRAERRGRPLQIVAASEAAGETLRLYGVDAMDRTDTSDGRSLPERWADGFTGWVIGMRAMVLLCADTFVWSFGGAARTRRLRKGAMWFEGNRLGFEALPIVGLIALLVGVVLCLQSAYQLRQFGANIYVANLIALSMTREMGPLMTANLLAGRSGAAIAAEIATMKVSEEVDALETMGLEPVRYVVVPKFQAITLSMPALSIYASALGIVGGFIVAFFYLDLTAAAFFGRVARVLVLKDIATGLVKSVAFAWIIVLVAARQGFEARGGAESVGQVTTTSVVRSIFWVIVADAAFSLLFYF